MGQVARALVVSATLAATVLAGGALGQSAPRPGRFAVNGLAIGLEYAVMDNSRLVANMAGALADTGLPAIKLYVESVQWGAMQAGPNRPIDFSKLDLFVREYQAAGFSTLTVSLKPHSEWASKAVGRLRSTNARPRPEYRGHFQSWVSQVVERYDRDGRSDMPGLRWPVRYVEIGNEFSSYEPEPVAEYLETLRLAYDAAHEAFDRVMVGHAAFLFAPVNMAVSDPSEYDAVWAQTPRVDTHHGLADMRAILDHPERFDFINFHNLSDPYEIEHVMRWIAHETGRRGYGRPVLISDTMPTSYLGWGPATTCTGKPLAVVIPPALERDRCRLAAYFSKLVDGDVATQAWTRAFLAADHVQRAVIAAEQGIVLINLGFTHDLPFLTSRALKAGAGISAWGGALRITTFTGAVHERYPAFHAIAQLVRHLTGYRSVERLVLTDPRARVYRVDGPQGATWIAWRDPKGVLLPEDGEPSTSIDLRVGVTRVSIERVITQPGVSAPSTRQVDSAGGMLRIDLTHTPVFIRPSGG